MDPAFLVEVFDGAVGLPAAFVNDLVQTADGSLWVATQSGVARHNGLKFERVGSQSLRRDRADTPTALLLDEAGSGFWVGQFSGLSFVSGSRSRSWELPTPWDNGRIWKLWGRPDGSLLVGWEESLLLFRDDEFSAIAGPVARLGEINLIARTKSGAYFIAGREGVWVWDGDLASTPSPVTDWNGARIRWADRILELDNGRVLVSSSEGLGEVRGDRYEPLLRYKRGDLALHTGFLIQLRNRDVWLGVSRLGVFRLDPNKLEAYEELPYFRDFELGRCLEDHESNLWIAAGHRGLLKVRRRPIQKQEFYARGLRCECWGLLPQDEKGYWVATERGLFSVNDGQSTFVAPKVHESIVVRSLCVDSMGRLWYGAKNRFGVFHRGDYYEPTEGICEPHLPGTVNVFLERKEGEIWCGSQFGLYRFRTADVTMGGGIEPGPGFWICPSGFEEVGFAPLLPPTEVRYLFEDLDDRLWVGTRDSGLFREPEPGGEWIQYGADSGLNDLRITGVCRDLRERLWVATFGGLYLWNGSGFSEFRAEDGLLDEFINSLVVDDRGSLWLACNRGIIRVSSDELANAMDADFQHPVQLVLYDKSDGMPSSETNGGYGQGARRLNDGRLAFPTLNGLALLDPEKLHELESPPPITIRRFEIDQEVAREWFTFPATEGERMTIPAGKGRLIQIFFSANTFGAPERVQYRYQLAGLSSEWVEVREGQSAVFTDLPPGEYRFTVIGANSHGVWNRTGASLTLSVLSGFYETTWFRLSAVGGVVFLGWLAHKRRLAGRLAKAELELAVNLEKERNRIAGDMHDDLGNQLTRIAFLGTSRNGDSEADRLARITAIAQSSLESMAEIIWSISGQSRSLDSLFHHLREYALKLSEDTGQPIGVVLLGLGSSAEVSADVSRGLFLVVKEALSNAVKHANARRIDFSLVFDQQRIQGCVVDDGIGLPEEFESASGHGLGNMRQRIRALGGSLVLRQNQSSGTRVEFSVPLASRRPGEGLSS